MPRKYEDITKRVADIQTKRASAAKSASETPDATDPTEKGTVTPPNHPDGDSAAKKNLPEGTANTKGDTALPAGTTTNPSGHGENVPGDVCSGDAKDVQATKPNDPISKIAGILGRINKLRDTDADAKQAGAPASKTERESEGSQLSYEVRVKLANEICASEDGMLLAEQILKQASGRDAALELIKSAHEEYGAHLQHIHQEDEQQKQASQEMEALNGYYDELTKNASEEDMQKIAKFQKVHSAVIDSLEYDFEKQAYFKSAMDAAAMEDAMVAGAAPEEAMIPEGGEEPLSPEAIIELLEALVASGQMDEATAAAVAAEILGGGEMLPPEAGMEAMPPEAGMEAMPEEVKAANVILAELEAESK